MEDVKKSMDLSKDFQGDSQWTWYSLDTICDHVDLMNEKWGCVIQLNVQKLLEYNIETTKMFRGIWEDCLRIWILKVDKNLGYEKLRTDIVSRKHIKISWRQEQNRIQDQESCVTKSTDVHWFGYKITHTTMGMLILWISLQGDVSLGNNDPPSYEIPHGPRLRKHLF